MGAADQLPPTDSHACRQAAAYLDEAIDLISGPPPSESVTVFPVLQARTDLRRVRSQLKSIAAILDAPPGEAA